MKRYGLIGYPVKHSLSPAMHNAAFRDLGIDADYTLFEVRPEELRDFFASFRDKLSGANVTIPHKEACINYVDDPGPIGGGIGAVNTVVLADDGRLKGYNTDVTGFMKSLDKDLGFRPAGKKALILGAGGAARAVFYGLKALRIGQIVVVDVDSGKAVSLVNDLGEEGLDAAALGYDKQVIGELVLNCDLLVNATPCGMKKDDQRLLEPKYLHERLSVFDLIYNPKETLLIRDARKKGCNAVNGLGMLLYQGADAFTIWTGTEAPVEVMRAELRKALGQI